MSSHPLTPALGEETIPPDEPTQIETLIAIERSIQELKDRKHFPVRRNVHPKQHGCVRVEFVVESGLPEPCRHGLFRTPDRYAGLARFSNARQQNDELPDGHGMALKLFDVPGEKLLPEEKDAVTHDLVLVDHPVFFAANVAEMIPMMQHFRHLMVGGVLTKARTIFTAAVSQDHRFRILRQMAAKRPNNPLEVQYWSTTPYKLGPGAAKFCAVPQLDHLPAPARASADKLRLAMSSTLRERDVRFDIMAQLQTDATNMPVENPTIGWSSTQSPWIKVATLRIPAQTFEAPKQLMFGEDLSFNPWHALPEHRPLGGVNRARKLIYQVMSAHRRSLSGLAPREPGLAAMEAVFPAAGLRQGR